MRRPPAPSVAALLRDACGPLAEALGQHSDAEVRDVRRGNGPVGPLPGPFQR